jgi:hypothetical protein
MGSENGRLYLVNQRVMGANELLAVDRQNLRAVQEHLDLAMARLDRYADELERVNRKRTSHGSAVPSLMGKLSSSRKVSERQATQFSLTFGQQNVQIKTLQARVSQARSDEPSGFGQTRVGSLAPWTIIAVKSDDIAMNSYSFAIAFRAIPA